MQLESKHIYKNVAATKGLPEDLVKSIGDAVFQSLYALQRDPPNLILVLKGLGRRFLRKKKTQERLYYLERERERVVADEGYKTLKEVDDEAIMLRRAMDWYDEFSAMRKHIKTLRDEYPTSVEPSGPPKEVQQAGGDNSGEHQGLPTGKPPRLTFKDWFPSA